MIHTVVSVQNRPRAPTAWEWCTFLDVPLAKWANRVGVGTGIIVPLYYLQHFLRVLDRLPALIGIGIADLSASIFRVVKEKNKSEFAEARHVQNFEFF